MIRICLALFFILLVAACSSNPPGLAQRQTEESYLSDPNSVGFDIEPLPDHNSAHCWRASYTTGGKVAKFRVELGVSKPLEDKESRIFDVQSGKGRLVAEPGQMPVFCSLTSRKLWKQNRYRPKCSAQALFHSLTSASERTNGKPPVVVLDPILPAIGRLSNSLSAKADKAKSF